MGEYLLVLEENSGASEHITRHVIEADDRQMVKYHYHRTLKDWGWHNTQYGKHCLEGAHGLLSEIREIRELDSTEYRILKKHLPSWAKL